jgi:lipopolysaccharide/colanic/teichoic acid biosynthesis glycosyltransferase
MKRAFDIVASALGLVVLFPAMLAIAGLILMESGPPVLFQQIRVGRFGRDFRLYKFRSMTVLPGSEQGSFDAGKRQRVTRLGRFLRQAKLDEFPQLWNVLRGDMSLVGPRPEVRRWVEAYPDRWAKVHQLRPGITDPAAIQFRNEEELLARTSEPERTYRDIILPQKLTLYEAYSRTQSLGGDLLILLRTFAALLRSSDRL